jgi:hypothetical protein
MSDRMTLASNVLLFQAGWFACVLGAAHGMPWVGVVAAAAIVGWHVLRAPRPRRELALIALSAAVGALFETLLMREGWVRFDTGVLVDGAAPYWMVALWALFATTLNVSLRALRTRLGLAALLGAVGGPAAYYAGARLGAIEFSTLGAALAAIAVGWALLTPLLLGAARRFDGYVRP